MLYQYAIIDTEGCVMATQWCEGSRGNDYAAKMWAMDYPEHTLVICDPVLCANPDIGDTVEHDCNFVARFVYK